MRSTVPTRLFPWVVTFLEGSRNSPALGCLQIAMYWALALALALALPLVLLLHALYCVPLLLLLLLSLLLLLHTHAQEAHRCPIGSWAGLTGGLTSHTTLVLCA
jgi:hypothetical protein